MITMFPCSPGGAPIAGWWHPSAGGEGGGDRGGPGLSQGCGGAPSHGVGLHYFFSNICSE